MYTKNKDFADYMTVTDSQLSNIIESRIISMEKLTAPIIIRHIELLKSGGTYFVRTTSNDGLQGISVANDRAEYVVLILEKLVAPFFIGKDARDLDKLMDEVYVYKNNYLRTRKDWSLPMS